MSPSDSAKKDSEDNPSRGRRRGEASAQPRHEPTERTALLNEGYLSPDDPAVSKMFPMSLQT
jgi:hypothetical protein